GAKDKATNKEQTIRIQASGGLSDEDIEQMVKDAEANSEADKKRRELVEARNNADGLIYTTEKTMDEHGESLSDEDKGAIEGAIADLKAAIESEDADPADITAKTEALAEAAQKLGEALYKAQQEEAAAAGDAGMGDMGGPDAGSDAGAGGGDDATVVDADFEEVDDDPKDKTA
ncbi:MAG: Hsp70 family protein, partial [Alphaproteobacteria bacterium]